ncbi:phosphatase PAP2 family protein [Klenkia soli]|uniref:phosphatase PAP2 family protein n=1 Tax=Klenkia soli TaxID=1052260 RepID=UPI001F61A24D|nr:phosphatase PAP2 family protein [Klenkia soli]
MTTAQRVHPIGVRLLPVAGCALVVVLLGVGVAAGWAPQLRLDATVSQALYTGDDRPRWVSVLLEVLTAPGLSVTRFLVFLPVVVLLLRARRWATAVWVTVSVVGVGVATSAIKELVGRVRPDFAEGGAQYGSLSFPSGHSSGIACLVTTALVLAWPNLSRTARRWWTLTGVVVVAVVGTTRMLLGVHYLTDVLAGWAFGVGWTLLVVAVVEGVRWRRA